MCFVDSLGVTKLSIVALLALIEPEERYTFNIHHQYHKHSDLGYLFFFPFSHRQLLQLLNLCIISTQAPNPIPSPGFLQQPQPPRDPIHHAPRPRPHPQHRRAPARHLRPARVAHDPGAQTAVPGPGAQQLELGRARHLEGDFRLAG